MRMCFCVAVYHSRCAAALQGDGCQQVGVVERYGAVGAVELQFVQVKVLEGAGGKDQLHFSVAARQFCRNKAETRLNILLFRSQPRIAWVYLCQEEVTSFHLENEKEHHCANSLRSSYISYMLRLVLDNLLKLKLDLR